jgi:hypothetical protein
MLSNFIKQTFGLTGLILRQLDNADYGTVKEGGESVSFHQIPCPVPLKSKAPIHDSLNCKINFSFNLLCLKLTNKKDFFF